MAGPQAARSTCLTVHRENCHAKSTILPNPQFNSQEELEAYLAYQNQRREAKKRENVFYWKTIPMVLGAFVIGFVMLSYYPSTDMQSGKKRGNQNRTEQRIEAFLGLFGVDIEEHKRQRTEYMDRIRNSRVEIKETPVWSSSELNSFPQVLDW